MACVAWEGPHLKRHGFTLVELLVVVAIVAIMLSTAALSVGSSTAAVRMKNAVRSVWQLSGYARTMALLRQHAVVITYSEVWEGDSFVKSKIEVQAGTEVTTPTGELSSTVARSIFDPEAEPPEVDEEATDENSEENVVAEGIDAAAHEFPDIHLKVELLGEDGESLDGKKKNVSVFSNVDFLLGRGKAAAEESAKKDSSDGQRTGKAGDENDGTEQETREPVSIIFETNGRCEAHRILIWKDGQDESQATVLEVDRFGTIKNPDAEDDD